MVRVSRILKDYRETGALNSLIALWGFVDDTTFLTKAGAVGVVYRCAVKGESTQSVKVRPKDVSVHLGSYPGDGRVTEPSKPRGQRPVSRAGQQACGPQRE